MGLSYTYWFTFYNSCFLHSQKDMNFWGHNSNTLLPSLPALEKEQQTKQTSIFFNPVSIVVHIFQHRNWSNIYNHKKLDLDSINIVILYGY